MSYKLSRGRYPTFLNIMYSNNRYGHKQILASDELRRLYQCAGISVLELRKLHELSISYRHYLRNLLRSERLAIIAYPFAWALLRLFQVKNKMIAVGRKQ